MRHSEPSFLSPRLAAQADLIGSSYHRLLGRPLIEPASEGESLAEAIFRAPFVVVSHDTSADPLFNYGNQKALELWEMSLQEFLGLPSRYSAEAEHRQERERLLRSVGARGVFEGYRGVRASKTGRRFLIEGATVFNLVDDEGQPRGQAATFRDWTYL